ncbi:transient receptor potential cation channel subfamily A member 1-like [Ostrea edulis]|uniref:transient receptor potential cation channel subfamily A member 1-like n=1 Tax=Ostrea edulis TaxID=37623 RepID=UPI0024AF3132|nr:transient receptor potential cation channel subfamily A member 1-like [Ostrea edulis]
MGSPSKGKLRHVVGASTIYPAYKRGESVTEKALTDKSVWQAVRDGSTKELDWLLTEHPELKGERDFHGNTLLLIAAKYNLIQSARVLISHNVNLNEKNRNDGISPLHEASKYNSVDVGHLLIESGSDVMIRDNQEKTPLHHAARRGRVQMVELLLNDGNSDINATDEDKLTPLHESIIQKHDDTATLLMKSGADVMKTEINGITPYMFASAVELIDVMNMIWKTVFRQHGGPNSQLMVNQKDMWGNTALHMAVDNQCLKSIKEIAKHGGEIDSKNESGHTPLHRAAIFGDLEITDTLLSSGAAVDTRDNDSFTPLHRACLYNRHEVVSAFMKNGGDINKKTKELMTPLIMACWKGHLETVEFLLTNGAQIAAVDNLMKNALHWTVENAHLQVLLYLLKKCDSVMLESLDFAEQTITHYAAKLGNIAILQGLIQHDCKLDVRDRDGRTPIHIAAENDNEAAVEVLYHSSNSELNDGDSDGQTPLSLAVREGQYNTVKLLLSLGADITHRDENLCTALAVAAREGHVKIMKILLVHYAEINATDKNKNTPLHIASNKGHVDCVQVLLDKKADTMARNSRGQSPLDLAIENRHSDVAVTFMQSKGWTDIIGSRDANGKIPVDSMIRKCPEAFLIVMEKSMQTQGDIPDSVDFTQKFDFRFIDPGPEDLMSKNRRYYAYETMVKYNREELLTHPLVQQCLLLKWKTFGRPVYYLNVTLFILYLGMINIYGIFMPKISTNLLDNVRRCPITLNSTMLQNQTVVDYYVQNGQISNIIIESTGLTVLTAFLFAVVLMFYIRELISLYTRRWRYFLLPFNYVALTMLVGTSFALSPFNYIPCEHQWRAAWIATLSAWICLISILRGLDVVGIYFVMLEQVFMSLFKISLVLVVFLIAFSQAFYITMSQTAGFQPGEFFPLTVLSMTIGEINFIDNFMSGSNAAFYYDNLILFFLFALIMPISLMNLLIGVAVGDTEAVKKKAYMTRLSIQIDFLSNTETTFPRSLQKRFYKRSHTVMPNKNMYSKFNRFYENLFGERRNNQAFISEEKPDYVTENVKKLQEDVRKTKLQLAQATSLQKQSLELLKQMCEQLHVRYTLDNVSLAESHRTEIHSRIE